MLADARCRGRHATCSRAHSGSTYGPLAETIQATRYRPRGPRGCPRGLLALIAQRRSHGQAGRRLFAAVNSPRLRFPVVVSLGGAHLLGGRS
jgi:hypothetical protein